MAVNDTAAPHATDVRRHLLVIRLGLMVSVVINVVAGFIVVRVVMLAPIVPPAHHPTVGALVAVVALLAAAASFWWRRRTLTVEALAAGGAAGDLVMRFKQAHIVCWGVSEIASLAGLMATLVTGEIRFVFGGSVIALVLMAAIHRPDFSVLDAAARAPRRRAR